jgi:predicted Zn-dependent peptidase
MMIRGSKIWKLCLLGASFLLVIESWKFGQFPSFVSDRLKKSSVLQRVIQKRYLTQQPKKLSLPFSRMSTQLDVLNHEHDNTDDLRMTQQQQQPSLPMQAELPKHSKLTEGRLPNGLTYFILPNHNPSGRFEAHLEIMSGSIHELDNQQGMAHLLEHVTYMGSTKRQMISGTGSRTNAYTDFHHTVFYAACPTFVPSGFGMGKAMLPMAFDALVDVMTTTVDDARLEKEKAAVLSEASMVNTMDYRVECQILSGLHAENRISRRFPIGKESMIRSWKKEDLQFFHSLHYRPDNAILYLVGDLGGGGEERAIQSAVSLIEQKFGQLRPKLDSQKILQESGEFPDLVKGVSMKDFYRHFPPVSHRWSNTDTDTNTNTGTDRTQSSPTTKTTTSIQDNETKKNNNHISSSDSSYSSFPPEESNSISSSSSSTSSSSLSLETALLPITRLYKHELLQSFSFHLFAKKPIEQQKTIRTLKRELMKRIVLTALQIRLNVLQRNDPLFTLIDFNSLNWVREGCSVCSLDLTTDLTRWRPAVSLAIQEIRRMGLYGITAGEMIRYKQTLLSEIGQMFVQSEQQTHEEVLQELMEAEAVGNTFMAVSDKFAIINELLNNEITLEEVNEMSRELCEHLSHYHMNSNNSSSSETNKNIVVDMDNEEEERTTEEQQRQIFPTAIIACSPLYDHQKNIAENVTEKEVVKVVREAMEAAVIPLEETKVIERIFSEEEMEEKIRKNQPRWLEKTDSTIISSKKQERMKNRVPFFPSKSLREEGISQRTLSNGMKITLKSLADESQEVRVRLYCSGGRMNENSLSSPGSVLLGAKTMQEGGASSVVSREQAELFCIDHSIAVEIKAIEDALLIDLHSNTIKSIGKSITGMEGILQVAHVILSDFLFEKDAFARAKQSLHEQYYSMSRSLESSCKESVLYSLTGGNSRYLTPSHEQIEALSFDTTVAAVRPLLSPKNVEVVISGDLSLEELETLSLKYFGTVPATNDDEKEKKEKEEENNKTEATTKQQQQLESMECHTIGKEEQLSVFFSDSDKRAVGYLSGPAPNRWGIFSNGESISDRIKMINNSNRSVSSPGRKETIISSSSSSPQDIARRTHPLFGFTSLLILQEVSSISLSFYLSISLYFHFISFHFSFSCSTFVIRLPIVVCFQ